MIKKDFVIDFFYLKQIQSLFLKTSKNNNKISCYCKKRQNTKIIILVIIEFCQS